MTTQAIEQAFSKGMANERRKWLKKWTKTQSEKKISGNVESVSDGLYREGKQSVHKRDRHIDVLCYLWSKY